MLKALNSIRFSYDMTEIPTVKSWQNTNFVKMHSATLSKNRIYMYFTIRHFVLLLNKLEHKGCPVKKLHNNLFCFQSLEEKKIL